MASTRLIHRRAHGGRRCRVLKERMPRPSTKPYSCFSSVASTVAVAPALTVMVLSQVLNPDFASLILWSPTASRRDEGVLPMNFSSRVAPREKNERQARGFLLSGVNSECLNALPFRCNLGPSLAGKITERCHAGPL